MKKKTKVIGGSALALALALLGGTALTAGALADPTSPAGQVAPASATDGTDGADGESADPAEESGPDTDNVQEGPGDTSDGAESATENTGDDVNGVAVEDGAADGETADD